MTLKDAASGLGIPYQTLYTYETKPIEPKYSLLIKICDLYSYRDIYKLLSEDLCFT